jgi:hypothetical protein
MKRHRTHVEQPREIQSLELHLAKYAVDVFRATVDRGGNSRGLQLALEQRADRLDVALAVDAPFRQRAGDAVVGIGFEIAEGQVLEFPLEAPYAEAVRERSQDLARFDGELQSLRRRQLACVAQSHQLLGQPGEHQARIGRHGQQHLAQRLGLVFVEQLAGRPVRGQMQLAQRP